MKYALSLSLAGLVTLITLADEPVTKAFIDGTGTGWVALGEKDFVNVNCDPDTFVWKKDGSLYCKGTPVGVARSQKQYTNFELVLYWKHLKSAGNSGVFVWRRRSRCSPSNVTSFRMASKCRCSIMATPSNTRRVQARKRPGSQLMATCSPLGRRR
ncbi:MAG: DUF1080 domain-containing protein [Gemmatales bacterium]